jgi:hypothetical protein
MERRRLDGGTLESSTLGECANTNALLDFSSDGFHDRMEQYVRNTGSGKG